MKKVKLMIASLLLLFCVACENEHERTRREMEQVVKTEMSAGVLLEIEK